MRPLTRFGTPPAVASLSGARDSWSDGTNDGDYGLADTGAVYRWKAAISRWVPSGIYGNTFTQLGATLGASASPSGWTKIGTGFSTDGTTLTIGKSPNSDQSYLRRTTTAGSVLFLSGWYDCSTLSGTAADAAMVARYQNGTKERSFQLNSSRQLTCHGSAETGVDDGTSLATRKYVEIYFSAANGISYAYVNQSPVANAGIAYADGASTANNRLELGDASSGGTGVGNFEDFAAFVLT